jgi:hypothetical protein
MRAEAHDGRILLESTSSVPRVFSPLKLRRRWIRCGLRRDRNLPQERLRRGALEHFDVSIHVKHVDAAVGMVRGWLVREGNR